MDETEPRWWRHMIREHKSDRSGWRYWRMFATRRQSGGYRWGSGQRANLELSAEVLIGHRKSGHGLGWKVTVSDTGSVKVAVYLSRLGSVWLKAGHVLPNRLTPKRSAVTGFVVRVDSRRRPIVNWEVWHPENEHKRGTPWWRYRYVDVRRLIAGRTAHEYVDEPIGGVLVPMAEGPYQATAKRTTTTTRHVRFPGTWVDRLIGPRVRSYVDLSIEGGIPSWGKGENSWDCGMDGTFGVSGSTIEEAVGNAVSSTMRDRERYGGPHDLPRAMTVAEAERWAVSR